MTDTHDLYALPLDRFVPERTAAAKALRSQGDRDGAAKVAKLSKPSVAAWAVNQLVRTQRRKVAELFKLGDQLQRAQSELLAGRDAAQTLRSAADRERAAVDELTSTARGLLTSQGHELSAMTLERVRDTLHAAALDKDARAQVKEGCLERELRHVGIGDGGAASEPDKRRSAKATRARRASAQPSEAPARDKQAEREHAERLKNARKDAADARRAAERAARDLRAAQERKDRAAGALEDAEAALADARQRADEATRAEKRTQQELAEALG